MKSTRPVNLNLMTIRFPLAAIVSILHRASGAFLFLCIPYLLWLLQQSLISIDTFHEVQQTFDSPVCKGLIGLLSVALLYHLFAGIRHLLLDVGIGEHLKPAKHSAQCVLVLTAISAVLIGVWLW